MPIENGTPLFAAVGFSALDPFKDYLVDRLTEFPDLLAVALLGYSRAIYAEVMTRTEIETFLALHGRAFRFFGGMPAEILDRYVPGHHSPVRRGGGKSRCYPRRAVLAVRAGGRLCEFSAGLSTILGQVQGAPD